MTIERFTFKPPFQVRSANDLKLEDALVFAKRLEVPPGHKLDITPPGYRDKYALRTMSKQIGSAEDTVGEIEMVNAKTGARKKSDIDEATPVCVIARPNVLDGGEGIRIDEVVRYIPSQGAVKEKEDQTATAVPIEFFQPAEERGIPIELPVREEEMSYTPLNIPLY